MKILTYVLTSFFLTGCLFWDLMPSYSSCWDEDTWIHKDTKKPLTDDIHIACFNESIQGLEIRDVSGYPEVIGIKNQDQSNRNYALCLKRKGFVFNASYKYCYKFKSICDKYRK